ncbi:DUF4345 family protein [Nocardia terpenica]|uniref:DUF4345 family protein n=1 Tax=Nocardia terpenica TaxID=455432 RepID=UPI0018955DF1|nr:DUF4345 family protein [Nocardia terpenica]MBF6063057.1 DUF4345 family protein [Nocardia terpenica]MBF6104808.1 DUF4345 family protein [Nocardia terpenica]MBF6112756.1 DUF4345 family protein [Nocardia terpenica]MBF6118536.1 DUF4345 family protein [Nocardia terpenica]MBF6155015.1 DUF4345 family protein [Nocardia terpenica]
MLLVEIDSEVIVAVAVIIVAAAAFLGMGVYALWAPEALVRPFGIRLGGATGRYEVRAVYGGFGIAMAAILAVAACHPGSWRSGIVVTVAAALGGMAVGRIASAALDGRTALYPNWFYCIVEAAAAAALLATA